MYRFDNLATNANIIERCHFETFRAISTIDEIDFPPKIVSTIIKIISVQKSYGHPLTHTNARTHPHERTFDSPTFVRGYRSLRLIIQWSRQGTNLVTIRVHGWYLTVNSSCNHSIQTIRRNSWTSSVCVTR